MTGSGDSSTCALIVAHGERGGRADNGLLRSLGARVSLLCGDITVGVGVLNGEPLLESEIERLAGPGRRNLLVYPLFMSGGYFAGTLLHRRVEAATLPLCWRVLDPLGLHPALAGIVVSEAVAAARRQGWSAAGVRLVLAGHGSAQSRASADAATLLARAVGDTGIFAGVETAFVEEAPFVSEVLACGTAPSIVVGLFSGHGLHAEEDVRAAIARSGAGAVYTGPITAARGIARLIASDLRSAHLDTCGAAEQDRDAHKPKKRAL